MNAQLDTLSHTDDQVGNRLSESVNGTQTTYTYGSYNKLLSAGSTSYTYDPNGNMITITSGSTSWSYSYDYENRLKQVSLNGVTILQATYDGDGRRVKIVSGDTTVYDYLPGSWNPAYVKDLTLNKATDIIFAGGLMVGKVQGAASSYYHLDRLGSVRLVTQQSSTLSFQTTYQPYGSLSATSGSESFMFTGKQLDAATGLYYYGLRYYDSQSGRFISQDPMPANAENPQGLDRYVYVLDNPMVNTDPTGGVATTTVQDLAKLALEGQLRPLKNALIQKLLGMTTGQLRELAGLNTGAVSFTPQGIGFRPPNSLNPAIQQPVNYHALTQASTSRQATTTSFRPPVYGRFGLIGQPSNLVNTEASCQLGVDVLVGPTFFPGTNAGVTSALDLGVNAGVLAPELDPWLNPIPGSGGLLGTALGYEVGLLPGLAFAGGAPAIVDVAAIGVTYGLDLYFSGALGAHVCG